MIDYGRYQLAKLNPDPWPWLCFTDLLPSKTMHTLCESFPVDGFVLRNGGPTDPYRTLGRRLVHLGVKTIADQSDLDPMWISFCESLMCDDYHTALSNLTGIDLAQAGMQVSIYRNDPSCWLPAHTDDPPKLVTQTFYFNEGWAPRFGGELLLLGSQNEEDVVERIAPDARHSAILVRTENAWHAVLPRDRSAVVDSTWYERRSMVVQFFDHPEIWQNKYKGNPLGSSYD